MEGFEKPANLFKSLLEEGYANTPKRDVVREKRHSFTALLQEAAHFAKIMQYERASVCYEKALDYYSNDPYPDEFDLSDFDIFLMHFCLSFCYVISNKNLGFAIDMLNADIQMSKVFPALQYVLGMAYCKLNE